MGLNLPSFTCLGATVPPFPRVRFPPISSSLARCGIRTTYSTPGTSTCCKMDLFSHAMCGRRGDRGSCYNFQLKSLFVKSMLDTLYLSTHTLNILFVLMQCTIPLIFHIVVMQIYDIFHAKSTVTTSPESGARCYCKELVDRKASVTRTYYCYYINWIVHTYTS